MKKNMSLTSFFLAFLLVFSTFSTAKAAEKFVFDRTHTSIIWMASHLGFSKSHGHFKDFTGYVLLDHENPEKSYVEITIDTASILTGIPKFDQHLISKDFLHSAKHPTAKFISKKIILKGDDMAEIHGEFTLLGQTQPMILIAKLNKIDINPFNKKRTAGFSVTGSFNRSDYGMEYGLPMIPDEVQLIIEAEGISEHRK